MCINNGTLLCLLVGGFTVIQLMDGSKHNRRDAPPIVDLTVEGMFSRTREVYQNALKRFGPIIGVWRKGRLEYITNEIYAKQVLTTNDLFSFEKANAQILNLNVVLYIPGRSFFKDLVKLISESIDHNLDRIIKSVYPIFERRSRELCLATTRSSDAHTRCSPDFFVETQFTMAEVMVTVIFGKDHATSANIQSVVALTAVFATLTGMQYQNTSRFGRTFPRLYRMITWIRVMAVTVPFELCRSIGPLIWRITGEYARKSGPRATSMATPNEEPSSVLIYACDKYVNPSTMRLNRKDRLWIVVLMLGLLLASVHTTSVVATFVIYELARRPEYLQPLREELKTIVEHDSASGRTGLTLQSLSLATKADSFIREVMRLKGDTLAQVRMSTCDAPLGPYIIPKGCLVIPFSTLVHEDPTVFGADASTFNGFQWVEKSKPAVMAGASHIVFGLGRWACPGRNLAVNEIKLLLFNLIQIATPSLHEGTFEITDAMNTVTVPPRAALSLKALDV
ncbi:hypothetical protein PLICRDRAFT_57936 [Plicaturopsis crispa FD-325 SS-3]|uniref:Cytochrome P450 n=1 Tax=Plicaturopsis crispa FD-325 SS-3 TaxID=944288 RepID=A0A0C9SX37_PLICR|nr:hypothetical protein PLICRDRAFT_57936 [Plicaturopsis crispa FD-325 SS-3]